MEQEKVPQFLKEEGKILGLFTFKQLFIYAIGIFLSIAYYQLFNFFFFLVFSFLTFGIITAVIFVRINNQPFYKIFPEVLSNILFMRSGTWQPVRKTVKKEIRIPEIKFKEEKKEPKKKELPKFEQKKEIPSTNPYRFLPRK